MNVATEFAQEWDGFIRSYEAGRLAHAYIIVGSPQGAGNAFAEAILRCIFEVSGPDDPLAQRLEHRAHPDVLWIEPQSKSRVIRVEDVRSLNQRIQQTAMEGGWKVGIIRYADRLNEQAANAFLKTLEEPAGQTLLLLLTDAPHDLLPTIRSRCQTIALHGGMDQSLQPDWREALLSVLRTNRGRDPMDVLTLSESLRTLLDEIKQVIEAENEQRDGEDDKQYDARISARLLEARERVMRAVLHWQRDILFCVLGLNNPARLHYPDELAVLRDQSQKLSIAAARRRVEAVEDMVRRLDRNVPALLAFDAGFGSPLLANR